MKLPSALIVILVLLALTLLLVAFGGCVSPQQDAAFRSRVESVDFKATASGNQTGGYGGAVVTRIHFRDPRQVDYSKDK